MDWTLIFTNGWFESVGKNYSYLIVLVLALLKAVAVMHPGTTSNQVIDLIQGLLFKKKEG